MDWKRFFHFCASIFIFAILFCYFFHPITNLVGDLAFYLKTGQIILATHSIPTTNLFSYTNQNFPFINPNWLSELLFYLIKQWLGFQGLIILSTVIGINTFFIIFVYALKKYDPWTVLFVGLLSLQVLYERTDVKPELFSYLFLSLFLVILYTYREKFTRWIFIIIPLMLLWVNMHIYFFVGIAVMFLFAIDAIVVDRKNIFTYKNKILFFVILFCCVITFVNPQGIKGAFYPLFVTQNYAFPVEENVNFFTAISSYQDTTFFFFGIFVCLLCISLIRSFKKNKVVDGLLICFFTLMGFAAVRAFPLFIYGTFLPLVAALSPWAKNLWKKAGKYAWLIQGIGFGFVSLVLLPTIIFNIQNNNGVGLGVQDDAKEAIIFMKQHNLRGPIYNNFDIGDYLEYALYTYPQTGGKVFVDARAEAYPKSFFQNVYFPTQTSQNKFAALTKQYNFQTAVIAHTDTSDGNISLIQHLATDQQWKMIYINSSIIIFVRNTKENSSLIDEFAVKQKALHLTKDDTATKQHVRQLANVFRILGWNSLWLQMSEKYLTFDPTNCGALENVAYLLQKENSPKTQEAINIYITQCVPQNNL